MTDSSEVEETPPFQNPKCPAVLLWAARSGLGRSVLHKMLSRAVSGGPGVLTSSSTSPLVESLVRDQGGRAGEAERVRS